MCDVMSTAVAVMFGIHSRGGLETAKCQLHRPLKIRRAQPLIFVL